MDREVLARLGFPIQPGFAKASFLSLKKSSFALNSEFARFGFLSPNKGKSCSQPDSGQKKSGPRPNMAQRPCKDQSLRNVVGLTKLTQVLGDVESANLGMVKARAKAKVCLSQTL